MTNTLTSPFTPEQAPAPNGQPAPPSPGMTVEVTTITPDMAREWTCRNTRNRAVRRTKIAQFARDMQAGKWALNGEAVKFDTDGTLLDGQHRLYACVEADTPFQAVVVRGLPPEAQDTIDTGMARKMSDVLALNGEKDTALLAAVARWAWKWLHGVKTTGARDQEPTHAEMLALIDAEPRIRNAVIWANNARQQFKSVNGSVWGMAFLLLYGADHLSAEVFLGKVLTGENCAKGDPALAFRNRIWRAREDGERLNQYKQLGYLILAWNAFREDRNLFRLQEPRGGFTTKNFPEPK